MVAHAEGVGVSPPSTCVGEWLTVTEAVWVTVEECVGPPAGNPAPGGLRLPQRKVPLGELVEEEQGEGVEEREELREADQVAELE